MRCRISDLSKITEFLDVAWSQGGRYVQVSRFHVIKNEDYKLPVLSGNTLHFVTDQNAKKEIFSIPDLQELIKKVCHQNEDIRQFVKFIKEHRDFIVDLRRMSHVYDRIESMNNWQHLRQKARTSGTPLKGKNDKTYVHIINHNLKRLCEIQGGYAHAIKWMKENDDTNFKLPYQYSNKVREVLSLSPLTLDELTRIRNWAKPFESKKITAYTKRI
jgi:hypothetical protein